jgi:3',5'-cyclic-AMP phosphodiesterase
MPIHLPALSRRKFFAQSLAGTAALALSPHLLAAAKPTDPNSWALLSDLHLAADPAKVSRDINMTGHLLRALCDVLALPQLPAGLIMTGDCAHNSGQVEDYAHLAQLLGPVRKAPVPVTIGLGNHDNRERFWQALQAEKAAKRPLADRQVALLATPLANWIVLDSLEQTLATPGSLGPQQLEWLAQVLDANPAKPALVCLHHNPGTADGIEGLKDTAALMDVLRPRKQVKAYIFGHTHGWHVAQDSSGIHLVNLPPVAYVFRKGDPAGWVHAKLSPQGMRLELRCVDRQHKLQGQVMELPWRAA